MYCTTPITIYKRGQGAAVDPATGEVQRQMVACGQCRSCQAGRKNDWAGRLIAEASTAKDVYFVTLTYREKPTEFVYRDIQLMLKKLRSDLDRKHAGTGVRFFCVGERGEKNGRIHWHLLLFFDRAHCIARTTRGKLWEYWPHGWASIDHVPQADTVRRVRYCAKYAVKTVGNTDLCRLRCSLKPAIGGVFLRDFAENLAETALPVKGFFHLPGMVWERHHSRCSEAGGCDKQCRKGQHVRYRLKGASARMVTRTYCETWERVRPSKPWHTTPFLARYYPEEMMERHRLWPETNKAKLERLPVDHVGRITFRQIENPCQHLMGVPVNVFETPEEAAARAETEEFFANAKAEQDRVERFQRAEADRNRRFARVVKLGYAPTDDYVAHYVEHGRVPQEGEFKILAKFGQAVFDGEVVDGEAGVKSGFPDVEAFLDPAYRVAQEADFAKRKAIWAQGWDAIQWFDREKGDYHWFPQSRGKYGLQPPAVDETRFERVVVRDVENEQARIARNRAETVYPGTIPGGLAERATRRSIGSAESRERERQALEQRYARATEERSW